MPKKEKACKECGRIYSSQEVCIYCNVPTSPDWLGYVRILDPEKSEIAQKLGINAKGKFALRIK
ncbi:MAG: DNA-directed RNA polymerase subunit E [Euryarchaeota archaeon]|nr:DNA-directed RNA polymerase subunit E [Euryarchaeota archaeon]